MNRADRTLASGEWNRAKALPGAVIEALLLRAPGSETVTASVPRARRVPRGARPRAGSTRRLADRRPHPRRR